MTPAEPTAQQAELAHRRSTTQQTGGPARLARTQARGALNARERIHTLLDPDSFFEIGLLVHSDVPEMASRTPADGKVCGIGQIDGRTVAVNADDATVLAGTGGRVGSHKAKTLLKLAIAKGYPYINLGEAGGARLPDIQGSDGLSSMTVGTTASLRCRQVPMAAAILGECFGSPSWYAAFADFVVQLKGSCIAVSDPAVLAAHAQRQAALRDELQAASTPWRAAGLGYLDDVIPPEDTRQVLMESIRLARGNGGLGAHRLAAWPTSF